MPVSNSIPLEGVLNCWTDPYDLPDLLLAVSRSGKTGRLTFSSPEGDKTIYIKDGKVVFADSSSDDDGLGQHLLRNGQISLEDFRRVSKLVSPGKRLGALLVAEGVLEPKDLVPAVVGQVRAIILGLFRRTESWYKFKEESLPRKESITLDMPVWQLILDGVQLVESWRRISKGVGDFDATFHVSSATEVEWSRLNLESGPTELLTILSEPTPIADVCARASIDAFDTCRYLWAFRSLEWIEPAEISVETAAELAERAETVAPSPVPNLATTVVNLEPPPPIPQRLLVTQVSAAKTPKAAPKTPEVPKAPPQASPATTRPEIQPAPNPAPALHHTRLFVEPPPEPRRTPPSTTGELMEAILDGRGDVPAPVSKPPEPEAPEAPPDSATRFFPGASALEPSAPPEEDFFQGSPEFASMSLDYALSSPPDLAPPEAQSEPALSSFAEVAQLAEAPEAEMPLIEATVLEEPQPLPPQLVATQPSIPTSQEAPSGLELFAMNDPFATAEAAAPPATAIASADPLEYADASIAAALPSRPKTDELDLDIGHFFAGNDTK